MSFIVSEFPKYSIWSHVENVFDLTDKSDWGDEKWEWEDTPHRGSHSAHRHHRPSPSPMLVAASPDARLVSPWLGGQTPHCGNIIFINS